MVMDQMTRQRLHDAGTLTECNSPQRNISRDCGSGKKVNISSMSDLVPEAEVDILNKAVPEVSEENESSPAKDLAEKEIGNLMILDEEELDPELLSPESRPKHKPKQDSTEILSSLKKKEGE